MPREGPLQDTNTSDEARMDVQSDGILHRLARLPPASPFGSIEVGRAKEGIQVQHNKYCGVLAGGPAGRPGRSTSAVVSPDRVRR